MSVSSFRWILSPTWGSTWLLWSLTSLWHEIHHLGTEDIHRSISKIHWKWHGQEQTTFRRGICSVQPGNIWKLGIDGTEKDLSCELYDVGFWLKQVKIASRPTSQTPLIWSDLAVLLVQWSVLGIENNGKQTPIYKCEYHYTDYTGFWHVMTRTTRE